MDDRQHVEPDSNQMNEEVVEDQPVPAWMTWAGLIGIILITIAAGIGRLLELGSLPRGLAEAELEHGLLARQASDFGLQWATENAGPLAIPLVLVIMLIGELTGFDIETPRIAAALFGAGSILFTGLWLFRAMGPIWGVAGAAVLAGSFWHVLFSRLATGQIAGTFAFALFCWAITEAGTRRDRSAMPWYLLAGLATGIGFLSTPALRLLPLVLLVVLAVSLWRMRSNPEQSEARSWLVATAASYLTISPYLFAHRGDLQLWTPFADTPGLPGNDAVTIPTLATSIIDTFTALFLPDDAVRGLNLPADAWFSLLIIPWVLIGVLGLISASNNPHQRASFQVGLAVGIAVLLGIVARNAGHPGQLVVISPALAGVAVLGFRTILRWARVRTVRYALAGLIVLGVAGQGVVTAQQYVDDWATAPETEVTFYANVTDALIAADSLDTREPVFFSLTGHETARDYFRSPLRRHSFDGASVLQFPAEEDGYLIDTGSPPLSHEFVELLESAGSVTQVRDDSETAAYRLDGRIREQMPFSAPTVPYPAGAVLHGSSDPSRAGEGSIRVMVAWNVEPESPPFEVETRLRTAEAFPETESQRLELPSNPLSTRLFQILLFEIDIPAYDIPTDIEVRLFREDGAIAPVAGMDDDGFLVLNRYTFVE